MSNDAALKSVKRGDSPEVIFQVGDINAIRKHVRNAKQAIGTAGNNELRPRESWRMKAKNTTGDDLGRGVFISLDGVLYSEADNESEFKGRPTANIVELESGKVTAITADFINDGNIGPVVTSGVWNADVFVNDTDHKFADIALGIMTSQSSIGPVSIISAPASTGVQNCVVSLSASGPSGYEGPFKLEAVSATSWIVGRRRAETEYQHIDSLTIMQSDGKVVGTNEKTTHETAGSVSASTWVYYRINRNSSDEWVMTIATSTVWPPAPSSTNKDDIFIQIGYLLFSAGAIVGVSQSLRGNVVLFERPILTNGQAAYKNNTMLLAGMTVNIGGVTRDIPSASYALSTDTYVYIEATHTIATGQWSITSTYQNSSYDPYDLSSGIETYHWLIAEIASGKAIQHRIGDIDYPLGPGDHDTSPGTYKGWTTDHEGKKEWHPVGFWAEITSETGYGVYNMKAADKAALTFSATEQQLITGLAVGHKVYVQYSNSGTSDKYYFCGGIADKKVASKSGQTAGYLQDVIADGDGAAFAAATDVHVKGETTTAAAEVKLYAAFDSVTGWSTGDTVGVFSRQSGTIEWLPGIELGAALALLSGHATDYYLRGTASGAEWRSS